MKHLLILLISILLLSSPVIGDNHKGETLYGWGNTLPYVWKGVGDKDTHSKYQGQVKDGKEHGQGTETYPNGDKYKGEFKDGRKHGQGTYSFYDGRKYVGEWKYGKRDGQGTGILPDGTKFVGEHKDDRPWNGTLYDKYGNILDKLVNGVNQ